MTSRTITFESEGRQLAGQLDLPARSAPKGAVLLAHCFTCSRRFKTIAYLSRAFVDRGFGVFRFDFAGLGESEGPFEKTTFTSNVADILAAAARSEAEGHPAQILIGHSLGGAAVVIAAKKMNPSCRAVVTLNAPSDPAHVLKQFGSGRAEIERTGEATVNLAGRPFKIRRQFIEDISEQNLRAHLAELRQPILVAHSPIDTVVGVEHAAEIFNAARHPKSFVSLDDADHFLLQRKHCEYVAEVTVAWASLYL